MITGYKRGGRATRIGGRAGSVAVLLLAASWRACGPGVVPTPGLDAAERHDAESTPRAGAPVHDTADDD